MDEFKGPSRYIECICPTCGIKHKYRMFWTGTCTPRKYCKEHKEVASKLSEETTHALSFGPDGRVAPHLPDQSMYENR